jgi:hypothetical protein
MEYGNTIYWAYEFRPTNRTDLGHMCKECKKPFTSLNEIITIRRGGRIELRYHKNCFSGYADPRSKKQNQKIKKRRRKIKQKIKTNL